MSAPADVQLTATIAVVVISILNMISAKLGSSTQVFLTIIKVFSLIFVAVLGLVALIKNGPGDSFSSGNFFAGSSKSPSSYAIALYSGLWAFDGWDQCSVSVQAGFRPDRNPVCGRGDDQSHTRSAASSALVHDDRPCPLSCCQCLLLRCSGRCGGGFVEHGRS